jgi:hypothetical protein
VNAGALYPYSVYFCPGLLTGVPSLNVPWFMVVVEAIKWCIVVGIAVSLSIAQFAAWRHGKKTSARDSFARGFHRTRIAVWPDSDFEKRIT